MSSLQESLRKVKSEELLSRFRSKEDIYKYMTLQMGLFLPSFKGTKLSFIRAILSNEKKALRQKDVIVVNVPQYEEISVKNLYNDAMNDEMLRDYLPNLEMNSNRLPERNFFFGILGTIRNDYLSQIINDANNKRFSVEENHQENNYIAIDENWYEELIKHPFLSKKPGKAIHLIKQRSKLVRNRKMYHKFDLSQRLSQNIEEEDNEIVQNYGNGIKRRKTQDSQHEILSVQTENLQSNGMIFQI